VLDSAGEKLRQVLKGLESAQENGTQAELNEQTRELIRAHLAENQELVRDLQERLRMSKEESEAQAKRRAEVEKMLSKRDAAYEELLGMPTCGFPDELTR
jgi:kinesin family protein 5